MLLVPAFLESFRSLKDKTLKVTFETNEPNAQQLAALASNNGKFGFLAFKEDTLKERELEVLENLESDYTPGQKSRAQRLRAVLYKNWEFEPKGYEVFEDYYNHHLERLINHFKQKLPE